MSPPQATQLPRCKVSDIDENRASGLTFRTSMVVSSSHKGGGSWACRSLARLSSRCSRPLWLLGAANEPDEGGGMAPPLPPPARAPPLPPLPLPPPAARKEKEPNAPPSAAPLKEFVRKLPPPPLPRSRTTHELRRGHELAAEPRCPPPPPTADASTTGNAAELPAAARVACSPKVLPLSLRYKCMSGVAWDWDLKQGGMNWLLAANERDEDYSIIVRRGP